MASLFTLDDQIHQAFEQELRKELATFVKTTAPLYTKMKTQLIEQLMISVRKGFKCFQDDTIKRLQTNLAFGGKDLPEDEFEKVLVNSAGAELSAKANQAFHQTVTIASDYLYEKMHSQLQDIADELASEVALASLQTDEMKKSTTTKEPVKEPKEPAAKAAKGPPQKAQPKPPTKPDAKSKPAKKAVAPSVDVLPKIEGNLEHAVKDRPAQQNKRPPTRKKRPAPPQQIVM